MIEFYLVIVSNLVNKQKDYEVRDGRRVFRESIIIEHRMKNSAKPKRFLLAFFFGQFRNITAALKLTLKDMYLSTSAQERELPETTFPIFIYPTKSSYD